MGYSPHYEQARHRRSRSYPHLLCEGQSIRAITRLTGASKNTVTKLLIDAGKACAAYHNEHVRDLTSKRIQVDEIGSFTYSKQKNVAAAKAAPEHAGDTWTWTAIDADTKLIASYLVGGRDSEYAMWFMDDPRGRGSRTASSSRQTGTGPTSKPSRVRLERTWTMPSS